MQEIDGKYGKCYRYAPRRKNVRRIYLGRIVALVSFVCFAVCVLLLVFARTSKLKIAIKSEEYFFVMTASTAFSSDAAEKALALKTAGGAGYVLNDGVFKVMADVYLSEGDAAAASKRWSAAGVTATVTSYSTDKVKIDSYNDKSKNSVVAELFSYPKTVVKELESLSGEYDGAAISEPLLLLRAEKLRNSVKKKSADAENLDGDIADMLKLMYARFDLSFERFFDLQTRISVRSAIKELSCSVAAENVAAVRNIVA